MEFAHQVALLDALGNLQDGVAVYDADDRLVTCNERYRQSLGVCGPLVQPGLLFHDLLTAVAAAGVMVDAIGREAEWVEDVMVEHRSCQLVPQERRLSDGRWLSVSVYPTADGGHLRIMADITDRKRVEAALQESEQRFRDLAESASDWFWEVDGDLRFTYVSDRVAEVLGVGPAFFLGRSFEDLGLSCEDEAAWHRQRRLMAGWQPFRGFVFVQRLPSGEAKYVEMAGRAIIDAGGHPRGYRGTASDITALKQQERELAEQSSLRQAIIDHMGQGVVVFDGREQLVAINGNARRLLDLPGGLMVPGESTLEGFFTHLAQQGELGDGDPAQLVARRLARARWHPAEVFEHARPSGLVLEARSSAMPGGGLIFTFTDITEHKRIEDTLRDARDAAERGSRAKASFLANISHELRTPLNAIIGFSELMKHSIFGPIEPEPYRVYVDDISESGMHLLALINDILDMSKAEAGMSQLVETEVDIAETVRSALRMMGQRAELNTVSVVESLAGDLPRVRGDERRLRQIVLNLASNAVKFSDGRGEVTVAVSADQRGLVLVVRDQGIGMTGDELRQVMEPFVQADSRLSRKYEGTGLGLPLTKALVEAHGGSLRLESILGIGTTATVILPPSRLVTAPP